MEENKMKSPIELFKESYKAVRRNLALFIFLNALTILGLAWDIGLEVRDVSNGSSWSDVVSNSLTGENDPQLNGLITLVALLVGVVLYFLSFILSLKAAKQKRVDFKEVWETFTVKWLKLLGVVVLVILIFIAGLLAFVLPGLYLISRLAIAPFVAIDQDLKVFDAISKSWQLTKGHAWSVFVTIFFAIVLWLPSLIPIIGPLLSAALIIAYSVAMPLRYLELKKLSK